MKVSHISRPDYQSSSNPLHPQVAKAALSLLAGTLSRRTVADLARSMVHSRRAVGRIAVLDWIKGLSDCETNPNIHTLVESVLDDLCDHKDIGFGTSCGEQVLLALPERRVQLPDGKVIALGDHGIGLKAGSGMLFPESEGRATASLISILRGSDAQADFAGLDTLPAAGRWNQTAAMPRSLRRALTICGTFEPLTQEWSMSSTNASFLNDWFQLTGHPEGTPQETEPVNDSSQQRVADAPSNTRVVVEAGPGSGKTHTACRRVISLVQQMGVAPARLLVLSFTRLAVAELRERINSALVEEPNLAVLQLRTFDSFASRLTSVSGLAATAGYDANIQAATRLLKSGDPLIGDAIDQLEHVIIDEAQDLVGDRKALCEALIGLLHPDCGVTVFGDFAQSIYGYQRRGGGEATFLAEITTHDGFGVEKLEHDHRTKTDVLRKMFFDVREELREDAEGARETYFNVRDQICSAAIEDGIADFATHASTTRGLILARSRKGLITAAEMLRSEGREFRLRLPDRPLRIAPWIGAALGGLQANEQISRDTFAILYDDLTPTPSCGIDECWGILRDLDGSGRDAVRIGRIAEALEDPPRELICDHEGNGGPLLSTIHAIKGRESEDVMLLLTRAPSGDDVDWAEEARTLYVGATRASRALRTSWINPAKFYPKGSPQRYWAARADHRLIEVGLEGDLVDWQDFSGNRHIDDPRTVIAAIWRAGTGIKAVAKPDSERTLLVCQLGESTSVIGCFSSEFLQAVQSIVPAGTDSSPSQRIEDISVVGATTVVVPGRPGELPSLALAPLLGGFARIPR